MTVGGPRPVLPGVPIVRFAFRNLLARKARSLLALLGLSVAILGVVALIALTRGVEATIHESMEKVDGLIVIANGIASPVLSSLPLAHAEGIRVAGVRTVVPEVFWAVLTLENEPFFARGPESAYLILGSDIEVRRTMRDGGIFSESMREGHLPEGPDEAAISNACAATYGKRLGDRLQVLSLSLRIVGIFETGSPIFDRQILVTLDTARRLSGKAADMVSVFYIELEDGANPDDVIPRITAAVPGVQVMTAGGYGDVLSGLVHDIEPLLWGISMIAVLVSTIGVLNTMLMSVTERVPEFGILRATGWTRWDICRLVLSESFVLGVVGGFVGSGAGVALVHFVGGLVPVRPDAPPSLVGLAFAMSVGLGMLGGIYPALRAGWLDPMAALRRG